MNVRIWHNLLFGLALLMFFAAPVFAHAASLYFAPASGSYKVGEQFSVNIFVSSDGQEINATEATISTTDNKLQLVSVSQAGSIIDFWAQEPQISGGGSVSFEGVMLGGGYSGSSGKLATVVLRARSQGDTSLSIISGTVLANDGQGTVLSTNLGTARFTIGPAVIPLVAETTSDDFVFTKNLRQGDGGEEVTSLQMCLRNQGFYTEDITGYFGAQTRQAVIDFQEFYYDDILAPWEFTKGTGLVSNTTREKLNEVCPTSKELKESFFNITVVFEKIHFTNLNEPVALITFEDFKGDPVSVDLTFTIVDLVGDIYFTETESIIVETNQTIRKTFEGIELVPQHYTFLLEARYGDSIVEEFYVNFSIAPEIKKDTILMNIWFWIGTTAFLAIVIILLLIVIIVLLLRRRSKHGEWKQKQTLGKEEAILRQTQRYLLRNKIKAEQELRKVENRLKRFSEKDDSTPNT